MNSEIGNISPGLLDDLKSIGVRSGDCLVVHSSFKSLGLDDASPSDVIRTLIEAVGVDGTLMMPTFTYCYSGIWGVQPYDRGATPSRFMGILPETLRTYPGALRSGSPTYSVAAVGARAKRLTEHKENSGGLGIGSSFETAYRLNARILLLGVGNNRNSMIHYAEAASGLPICDIPYREFWGRTALAFKEGKVVEVPLTDFPGCSVNFGAADGLLEQAGILTRGRIRASEAMLMDSKPLVDTIAEELRWNPTWLMCDSIVCEPCNLRKRRLRERGLTG